MKNPNDSIGKRTRDLPAFSAVPQPTAPPSTKIHSHTLCRRKQGSSKKILYLTFLRRAVK